MSTQSEGSPALFTRKATGLVREAKTRDALFYNLLWSSVALTFAFYWLFFAFYPGANPYVGILIAAGLGLPGSFLYAMLTQIMPRTGGDYVFNSRALHPSIGFAGNFSYCFWLAIVIGVYTTYFAAYGMGAWGRMMAGFTGSSGWMSFGDWFSTEWGLFITGTVALLLSAALFIRGGTRLFFKVQAVGFFIYLAGAFLVPILVGLFQSESGFVSAFNDYAANLGVNDAVGALTKSASDAGYASSSFDFEMTVKSVSIFWFIFGFIYSSNYFAGEIRVTRGTHLKSMPGAVLIAVTALLLLLPAFLNVAGYDFNGMLGYADPASYGFVAGAPAYPELMAIASNSPVLGTIIILGFALGLLLWLPQTLLLVSRSMFAWSFDRIMPEKLSYVDPRSRSPLIAIGVMLVLSIGSTAIYAFTDWFSAVSVLLGLSLTLLITSISGIVLPFRQPAMVEGSPYNRKVLGIPLISLVGFLALLGFGTAIGIILWDPGSGASLSANPGKLKLALLVYVVAFIIYGVARAVRKSQGIDLSLAHRELPPE
ncbi:MAG: APC family permease [Solirubrobacterales bacterium]|nr:APC family permease [Solirubrobacterales bacterium]MCB0859889.1 APC family permease [Solirubrobacterales bacterium]MCB0862791.1 APC family permease [Solirubrobacterales bacterium]